DFAAHKLDDPHVMTLLRLLPHKTPEAEQFALAQLTSPRSNAVWKMAARRLYAYAGEQLPDSYQHHAAIERFTGKNVESTKAEQQAAAEQSTKPKLEAPSAPKSAVVLPLTKPKPKTVSKKESPATKKVRTHVVQEGDSLWKIARRYKVDIETLKKANNLQSDRLRPGTTLKIPG
ncbi:MAG: LysM peptidoglycan-binding domain-containing protein, partial [Parachlamydia sp.]|nr:LysM peptidoglycan-binding domain-containing protein [Parachlamydia sp.]